MTDMKVIKGLHKTILIPTSSKGEAWIRENIDRPGIELSVTINSEYTDEMLETLRAANLGVEY